MHDLALLFIHLLAPVAMNRWSGSVESGYGVHLVRIDESVPGRVPWLEKVHDVILREWKTEKAMEMGEQIYSRLRARYSVELPNDVARANP